MIIIIPFTNVYSMIMVTRKEFWKTTGYIFTTILLCLTIVEIVVSQQITACDYTGSLRLSLKNYLLIHGIVTLVYFTCLYGIGYFGPRLAIKGYCSCIPMFTSCYIGFLLVLLLLYLLFQFTWFILGCIVIFNDNIECFNQNNTLVVFTLIVWALNAIDACLFTRISIRYNDTNYCIGHCFGDCMGENDA